MWCAPETELRDPLEAVLRLSGRPGLAWLDGDGLSEQGRWSFVGSDPVEIRSARFGDPEAIRSIPEPWADVDGRARATRPMPAEGTSEGPPLAVVPQWIGYIAYDAFPAVIAVPLVHARADRAVSYWARHDALFAFDRLAGRAYVVGDDAQACAALRSRLGPKVHPVARAGELVVEDPAIHLRAIEAVLEHIARGDVYQANLARRFSAQLEGDALALFLAMREESPVPFGFFLRTDELAVLGRSMERFLRWEGRGGHLVSRPIKGTIARENGQDRAAASSLRADPKEHAEHAMIVDLVRNDLGRVASVGTVEVDDLFSVEPYAKLSHLVSTVRCRTRPDVGLADVLEATFPPGSVTGTPKVRAVQIIEALERAPRGIYCGAVGAIDRAGGLSLSVAIRTATVAGGTAEYFAGGGLVEASVPAREVAETELKARVFLDALARLR